MVVSGSLNVGSAPEEAFNFAASREGRVFRDLPGRKTLRFEYCGKSYFLKYHSGVGWREILKNICLLKRPVICAQDERRAIEVLSQAGVDTMTLAAFGVRGVNPAAIESFLITEELKPTLSLEDFIGSDRAADTRLRRGIIRKVAKMTSIMHSVGMNHRDLYLCHFLLDTACLEKGGIKISLIDLHRAQIRSQVPARWRAKDLASLYFSAWAAGLTDRERLLFLSCYFELPLKVIFKREKRLLQWLELESYRLRVKFERKYAG
nr:lipopolysaccharide core heptose(I) kinase RfaP [Litorivivens lipolytica]